MLPASRVVQGERVRGGVLSFFDSQTRAQPETARHRGVCLSARLPAGPRLSPVNSKRAERARLDQCEGARGADSALEKTRWGARLWPRSPRGPDPSRLFGILELKASETPLADVCHPCRRITGSRQSSSQTSFPRLRTPAQSRSGPWFNLLDPGAFWGNTHPNQLGSLLTLPRHCQIFLILIDHQKIRLLLFL